MAGKAATPPGLANLASQIQVTCCDTSQSKGLIHMFIIKASSGESNNTMPNHPTPLATGWAKIPLYAVNTGGA